MRITADGKAGIGTNPVFKFDVSGNGRFTNDLHAGALAVDTDTLYVDGTNNRVGISTNNPNAKLQIVGGDAAITTQGNGLILKAIDNNSICFRLIVNAAGVLATTSVPCP